MAKRKNKSEIDAGITANSGTDGLDQAANGSEETALPDDQRTKRTVVRNHFSPMVVQVPLAGWDARLTPVAVCIVKCPKGIAPSFASPKTKLYRIVSLKVADGSREFRLALDQAEMECDQLNHPTVELIGVNGEAAAKMIRAASVGIPGPKYEDVIMDDQSLLPQDSGDAA